MATPHLQDEFTPTRIFLPICGYALDQKLLHFAGRVARRNAARVDVVTVLQIPRGLPITAIREEETVRADERLAAAEAILTELEITVETELIQAREVSPALMEAITSYHADLVIVGIPYKERFGEFSIGKTALYLLNHAPCTVMAFREEIPAGKVIDVRLPS